MAPSHERNVTVIRQQDMLFGKKTVGVIQGIFSPNSPAVFQPVCESGCETELLIVVFSCLEWMKGCCAVSQGD